MPTIKKTVAILLSNYVQINVFVVNCGVTLIGLDVIAHGVSDKP
jgi:hypothetical protein